MGKDNLFAELTNELIKGSESQVADAITFIEANWGFGIKLTPAQRVVVKAFYQIPLDDTDLFPIYDVVKDRIIGHFTEKSFMRWMYENKRCNYPDIPTKPIKELVLVAGRRGGKCRCVEDYIHTSVGVITFKELLDRKDENIEIVTYNPETFKSEKTSDFIIWDNGERECLEIETKGHYKEVSSSNHPYLVWKTEDEYPQFVPLSEIKEGDSIAVSRKLDIFGKGGIGDNKAKLLGYLIGDGSIVRDVSFTTADSNILSEFSELVEKEYPNLCVKHNKNYDYLVIKSTRRYKSKDGTRNNPLWDFLKEQGVSGYKSKNKKIPESILRGSKSEISSFLSRLFSCDGSVCIESKTMSQHSHPKVFISYCSASKDLIYKVKSLLLKFGIYASIRIKKPKCNGSRFDKDGNPFVAYELNIHGKNDILTFSKEIGIFSKQEKLDKCIEILSGNKESKIWYEMMPLGAWNSIKKHLKTSKCSISSITKDRFRFKSEVSRRKLLSYLQRTNNKQFETLSKADIVWDKVKKITPVGVKRTVDLTINKTHIIGGEIVSHNTRVTSCILGYELYKLIKKGDPAKFYGKPEQQTIVVTNVAPTDDQAGLVYDFTLTAIEHCPIMKNRVHNKTQKYFSLFTDKDLELGKNKASLEFLTGGCSSNGLRGPDAIAVSMDEMAFFLTNESSKFSGAEVYGALTPSCKGFRGDGRVICISSPHARYGKFYDLYQQGMEEKESSTLVFQMYTAMINPDMISSDDLKTERRRNRRKFMAEFGAEFSDTVNAWVDDPNEFDAIVDKNFNIPKKGKQDIRYYAGLDLAFTNDGTALSVVHNDNGIITLDYSNVWFSGSSDVWMQEDSIYKNCSKYKHLTQLQMEDIVKEVKEVNKWFPIKKLVFDQHNGQGFLERCRQNEILFCEMVNFNDTLNSEIYEVTKRLYAEKLLKIWNHPILVRELLMLEAEELGTTGYKYDVHAPRRVGCHDDISESFARAVWACYNDKHKNFKAPPMNTYLSRDARYQALLSKYNNDNPRSAVRLGDKRGFYR